jgi:hypothetical protein
VSESSYVSKSLQNVVEHALNEESSNLLIAKGKNKIGDEEEVLMRGVSPIT